MLISPSGSDPVRLAPIQAGTKIQWNHQARMPQEATAEEMNAYDDLLRSLQQPSGEGDAVQVTGPLISSDSGWNMNVRIFRPVGADWQT